METFHTERLVLQRPSVADIQRYYAIHSDPQTNLFNPAGPMTLEGAERSFHAILEHWQSLRFGSWSIREKQDPAFVIGFGGLSNRLYGEEIKVNLGYRFDSKYWGKGYATELAQFAIGFGFSKLKIPEIFALVRPKHTASIRVLEKCNMRLYGGLDDVPGMDVSLVYHVLRPVP